VAGDLALLGRQRADQRPRCGPKAISASAATAKSVSAIAVAAGPRRRAPASANGRIRAEEAFIALAAISATPPRASRPVNSSAVPASTSMPISASLWAPGTANTTTSGLRP